MNTTLLMIQYNIKRESIFGKQIIYSIFSLGISNNLHIPVELEYVNLYINGNKNEYLFNDIDDYRNKSLVNEYDKYDLKIRELALKHLLEDHKHELDPIIK